MILQETTNKALTSITDSMETIYERMEKVYKEFETEAQKHSTSKYSIPNITKLISNDSTTHTQALKAIVEASYEGQKLTNQYYILFAPKINEYYYDSSALSKTLYNKFMIDVNVQAIKTSAEKERQYQLFSADVARINDKVNLLYENFTFLGKYAESIVYSLNRLQNLIESIDKMKAKEMWTEDAIQGVSLNNLNISDNISDDIDEFLD